MKFNKYDLKEGNITNLVNKYTVLAAMSAAGIIVGQSISNLLHSEVFHSAMSYIGEVGQSLNSGGMDLRNIGIISALAIGAGTIAIINKIDKKEQYNSRLR